MACLRSSGSFIRFLIIHTAHTHTHCVVQEQYFIVFVSAYTLSINACCQTCVRRRSRAPLIQTYASYMAETNRSTQTTHRCVLDHALRAGIKKTVHHAKVAVRIHSIVFLWALCRLNILTNPCPLSNMRHGGHHRFQHVLLRLTALLFGLRECALSRVCRRGEGREKPIVGQTRCRMTGAARTTDGAG